MTYTKRAFPNRTSHPEFLFALCALYGLKTTHLENCRILELNSGDGGNILPIAKRFPKMEIVGIGFDQESVNKGNLLIDELGLQKTQLIYINPDQIDTLRGEFDFILVNRLYSWVELEYRGRIWETCRRLLSQNGIVYCNFNTLPGWAELLTIRKLLLYRVRNGGERVKTVQEIEKIFSSFSKLISSSVKSSTYVEYFAEEIETLKALLNSEHQEVFFQDYLGDENNPVYLKDFLKEARSFGFKFLSDCDLSGIEYSGFPDDILHELLNSPADQFEPEQYCDFFVNRRYREVLLCRDSVLVKKKPDQTATRDFAISNSYPYKKSIRFSIKSLKKTFLAGDTV